MRTAKPLFVPFFALLALSAGCAGTPGAPAASYDQQGLRDTDKDVLFATEFPVESKADALLRADEARAAGDLDRALFFYVKALRFDPQDANLLAAIGLLHRHQGNDELAYRAYSLAIEAQPTYAEVIEARGLILLRNGKTEQARADFARALELDPTRWRSRNGLGLVADDSGAHEAAVEHYRRALELNPGSGEILNNRGYSYLLAGRDADAERDLDAAARTYGHAQAWINLGRLYAGRGDYDDAVAALREVLPGPDALNKVGEAAMAQGDYATAESLLDRAIKLSPAYFPAAEDNLAELRQLVAAVRDN